MKKYLQNLLAKKAKRLIEKHRPILVALTGSVGKTSTRKTIATVLSAKYRVYTPKENYNNELGVPLAILQAQAPGTSVFAWLRLWLTSPKQIPQVYVLEYGIDHPNDMDYLCAIAKPNISVMTAISPVHVEFFRSIEQLVEEKAKLLANTDPSGCVVLNADDDRVMGAAGHANASIVTYGFKQNAQIRALDVDVQTRVDDDFEPGELFSKIVTHIQTKPDESVEVVLKNQLGKSAVSSLLAAVAVAKYLGLTWEEILSTTQNFMREPGRMNPIPGIKGSLLIDSTYNAAPASMVEALHVLKSFVVENEARRMAVLGHMAELGDQTESEHRMVGMRVAELGIDELIVVGDVAKTIQQAAIEAGMDASHTESFATPEEAGRWLDAHVHTGDVVLVKGSQSARMEKVVKDVMAEPLRASELLVRQYGKWVQ